MTPLTFDDIEALKALVRNNGKTSRHEDLLGKLSSMQPRPEMLASNQESVLCDLAGLEDQIEKAHWLNSHFRAFEIANRCWQEHVRVNAHRAVGLEEV